MLQLPTFTFSENSLYLFLGGGGGAKLSVSDIFSRGPDGIRDGTRAVLGWYWAKSSGCGPARWGAVPDGKDST